MTNYQKGLVVYGLAAAAGLWLLAVPLVGLLFGDGYATAVLLLKILAWSVVPFTLSLPLSVELVVAGREKRVLLATVLVLLVTAVCAAFLHFGLGVSGVAISLVGGEWLLAALLFVAAR